MILKVLHRAHQSLSEAKTTKEEPRLGVRIIEAASPQDLRQRSFVAAIHELQQLPHYDHSIRNKLTGKSELVTDKIASIIIKQPKLINNPQVQKLLLDVIDFHHNWKDHHSVHKLLSQLQPIITPDLLNKASGETLRFVGALRTEYILVVSKTLKDLKKHFKDDLRVVIGYNGKLPPGLQIRLNTIRKLSREFENSQFGKYEPEIIADLKKTKSKWNRAVMPRLKNIKQFRKEFKESTGRHYGQKT